MYCCLTGGEIFRYQRNFLLSHSCNVNGVHLLSEPPAMDLHDDGRASLAAALRHGTVYTGADRTATWWQRWHTDGRRLTDRWHICTHRCTRSGWLDDTGCFRTSTCFIQLQLTHCTHCIANLNYRVPCSERYLYWEEAYVFATFGIKTGLHLPFCTVFLLV